MAKRYIVLSIALGTVALLTPIAYVLAARDQYATLLKKQGYTILKHPRDNFGVGTVIPLDPNKDIFIAAQKECFPHLEDHLQEGKIKLLDSTDDRNLSIDAAGVRAVILLLRSLSRSLKNSESLEASRESRIVTGRSPKGIGNRRFRTSLSATHTADAEALRSATQRRQRAALKAWQSSDDPRWLTDEVYRERIQPELRKITVSAIASALNVSLPYAAQIRAGRRRPHPRHWLTLAKLVGASPDLRAGAWRST